MVSDLWFTRQGRLGACSRAGERTGGAGEADRVFERSGGGHLDGHGTDEGVARASGVDDLHARCRDLMDLAISSEDGSAVAQGDNYGGGTPLQQSGGIVIC